MATVKDKIQEMGLTGEKIIINMLSSRGFKVESSIDKFDRYKDILVDGKYTVEVKTQCPLVKFDSFTFNLSQLRKCKSVDVLFFISVPHPKFRHYSDGWIYRVTPNMFEYKNWQDKTGSARILVPIKQDFVKPEIKCTDEQIAELQKYITTEYK
jgi:hypothetical protein